MRVFILVIVVHVRRADVVLEDSEGFRNAAHHVGVAAIEADSDIVEVHGMDELDEAIGRREFVGNVFEQHPHPERLGEGAQMLDGGHCRFELLIVKSLVWVADVLHEKAIRNIFGDFKRALDLIHGLDAFGAVGRGNVDGGRTGAAPFVVGVQGRVHGVERNSGGFKPVGDFADVLLAVGVIEVLASGEDFDGLRSRAD